MSLAPASSPASITSPASPRGRHIGRRRAAALLAATFAFSSVGSLTALVRPPSKSREGELAQAPMARSVVMILVGTIAAIWALASLVAG